MKFPGFAATALPSAAPPSSSSTQPPHRPPLPPPRSRCTSTASSVPPATSSPLHGTAPLSRTVVMSDLAANCGDYGKECNLEFLKKFHRRRLQVLAEVGTDAIVFEAIPTKFESRAYVELVEECSLCVPAWFAFASKDGINVVSADSLMECASMADSCKEVAAVCVNCTPQDLSMH